MDIRALAETAIGLAAGIAEQAYKTVTARINPDAADFDPVEETPATTWEVEKQVQALEYDHTSRKDGEDIVQKAFMVKLSDLGTFTNHTDTRAEIQVGSVTYRAAAVKIDPVAASAIFFIER